MLSATRSRSTCSARRAKAASRSSCAAPTRRAVHRPARLPAARPWCARASSGRSRCSPRGSPSSATPSPTSRRRRRRSRGRHRPGGRRRRPAAGHRGGRRDHAHGRERVLRARRAGAADRRGATEIGGRLPVNTDGGCLANGEPIGASGLRQVYENVLQLRGDAGERQVPDEPQVALHPRLRRARRQRVHGALAMTDAMRGSGDTA